MLEPWPLSVKCWRQTPECEALWIPSRFSGVNRGHSSSHLSKGELHWFCIQAKLIWILERHYFKESPRRCDSINTWWCTLLSSLHSTPFVSLAASLNLPTSCFPTGENPVLWGSRKKRKRHDVSLFLHSDRGPNASLPQNLCLFCEVALFVGL